LPGAKADAGISCRLTPPTAFRRIETLVRRTALARGLAARQRERRASVSTPFLVRLVSRGKRAAQPTSSLFNFSRYFGCPFQLNQTMNMLPKSLLPLLSFALLTSASCVSYRETKYTDVKRVQVAFASDKAARIFYEAFNAVGDVGRKTEKHASTWFWLTSYDNCTVQGPNVAFNEAVRFCDTDGDRQITEAEAEIFARSWSGSAAKK
jgi:hypothetical protein